MHREIMDYELPDTPYGRYKSDCPHQNRRKAFIADTQALQHEVRGFALGVILTSQTMGVVVSESSKAPCRKPFLVMAEPIKFSGREEVVFPPRNACDYAEILIIV